MKVYSSIAITEYSEVIEIICQDSFPIRGSRERSEIGSSLSNTWLPCQAPEST
jgi:hypothetical protein